MPAVSVNGAQLYYEVRGNGPAVLLIHGGGIDSGSFTRLADFLPTSCPLLLTIAGASRGVHAPRTGWTPRFRSTQKTPLAY